MQERVSYLKEWNPKVDFAMGMHHVLLLKEQYRRLMLWMNTLKLPEPSCSIFSWDIANSIDPNIIIPESDRQLYDTINTIGMSGSEMIYVIEKAFRFSYIDTSKLNGYDKSLPSLYEPTLLLIETFAHIGRGHDKWLEIGGYDHPTITARIYASGDEDPFIYDDTLVI
jgi:hypothetical protein